jgi:uncharacterized protein (TIGR03086 family)
MNTPELHARATAEFDRRVKAIGADQWHQPTPCSDWDVRTLVNHLVYENHWTRPLLDGATIEEIGDRFEGNLLGDEPKAAWEASAKEATAAVGRAGAMERTVHVSYGDIPGEEYAFQLFTDLLIHGWDLARGIGSDDSLDPELVEACYERIKPQEDMLKSSGLYGPKVEPPRDADRQTQLLAVVGRRR